MSGIKRAFLLSTADKYIAVAVGFATIACVSRLLTPAEIGIWLIGTSIITLASSAREFASSNFLIQKPDLSLDDIRSANTLMAIVTLAIMAVLVPAADWAATAYSVESLAWFLRLMSLSLLFDLFTAPIVALLRREMAFGKVAAIGTAGVAVNSVTVIGMAATGFGYMSFACGWVLSSAVSAALAVCLRSDLRIFKPSLASWREPIAFGRYFGANVLLYKIQESSLYLVLGRILPFDAVGLFNRATLMSQIPEKVLLGGVAALVVPAFSSCSREGNCVKTLYLGAIEYITVVMWPALILLVVLAHPAVDLVLGSQWLEAVPLVQIMAVAAMFYFTAHLDYAALIAVGGIRDSFLRALIVVPVNTAALIGAAFLGLLAMALVQVIVVPLESYISLRFLRRHMTVTWTEIGHALRKSAIVTVCTSALPVAALLYEGQQDLSIAAAALLAILAGASWLASVWLTRHPIWEEIRQSVAAVRASYSAKRRASPSPHAPGKATSPKPSQDPGLPPAAAQAQSSP
jgi:O-antigen/teichoic acid export membrane protein